MMPMNVKALVDLYSAILFQKAYKENNLPQNVYTLAKQMEVWLPNESRHHKKVAQDKPAHSQN